MILIIHEKRDQAEKVGAAMGWTKDVKNKCYNGFLNGQPCVSVWSKGHILGIKDPKESMPNMSWDDPRSLLPIQRDSTLVISKDAKDTKPGFLCSDYLKTIEKYIINADLVIGGTDPDREGEAIFWNFIKYFKYTGPVKRLWLAAGLDTVSIKEAMSNLREPDVSVGMAFAADSRRESDWCYMLLVVAYTYYGRYSVFGKNLEGVISLGRVQTPTLSLVVKRDYEVENFVPKDHFKISSSFNVGGAVLNGARYSPTITREMTLEPSNHIAWEQSRKVVAEGQDAPIDTPLYINKANVDDFKKRLLANANMAKISSYKESLKKEQPKKPFTSNTAIAAIVNKCKISTAAAQEVIEDLYAQGWTAYPRTSKPDLPYNLYLPAERNSLISSVLGIPELSAQAKEAMDIHNGTHGSFKPFVPSCFSKAEMEHYGIIPTHQVMTVAKLNSLPVSRNKKQHYTSEHLKEAYLLIAKQFIMALYPPAEYAVQSLELSVPVTDLHGIPQSIFKASASKIVMPGWRAAFSDTVFDIEDEDEGQQSSSIPRMRENDQCPLLDVSLSASKTKAPAKYDQVSLLNELENIGKYETDPKLRKLLVKSKGIGTPATRPETILQLIKHGYLAVSAKGVYTSTAKGRDLIKIAPSWLTNASLTAIWEDYLIKMCETRSESELIAMKKQFVDKQTTRISELIAKVIEDHDANKGERTVVKKPAKKPTPSMVNAIKAIAKSKGLTPDKAVFDDIKLASGFLNEHGAKKPEGYVFAPSESQMTLFNKINNGLPDNKKVNVASLTDNKMFSDFISKNMKEIPPSAPQKALAEKLIAAMSAEDQKKVKKNVLTSSSACSKFITDTIASNKKGNSKKK